MLPLENRLKNSTDIQKVFRGGKSAQNGFLFLKFCPNNLQNSRIAFSVGMKYSKSAVERNRAKRVLRAVTAQFLGKLEPGFDILVNLKKIEPKKVDFKATTDCLEKALLFAKLLKQ